MQLLFFAARRFIECCGQEQPTVFVFEDIHWAEPSEIALLGYLGQHVRDSQVMLVAAARPELLDTHPTWGAGLTAQTTIPLDPLQPADAEALAGHLLGARADAGPGLARVVETAGGNPLFLEELAASVVERGASGDLPVTVREAIAARIDALPEDARAALLSAAVVGKTFWRGVVAALAAVDEIDGALAVLEARDFVRRDAASDLSGDVQFTFKHMLIREVAYATVPRASRRRLHAAVARYVEETLTGAAETLSTILAHHWREAGEAERAIPYLLAAADVARRGWAHGAVVDLYSTAIELADDDATRRELRLQRGVALVELADYARASEELSELVHELEGQEKLGAMIALGHALVWTERHEEAIARASDARRLVEELDDTTALPAVLAMESQSLAMRGDEGDLARALELGDRALELWEPRARPLDLMQHLHLHADTTYWTGQYSRSAELSQRTRALANEEHRAESLLRGGGFEALALAGLGRHEEAIAIWDDMLLLARELGQSPRVLLNYSSLAYRELYDLDEARSRTERGARAVRRHDVRHAEAVRRLGPALHTPADGRRRCCAGGVARVLGGGRACDRLDALADRRSTRRRPCGDRAPCGEPRVRARMGRPCARRSPAARCGGSTRRDRWSCSDTRSAGSGGATRPSQRFALLSASPTSWSDRRHGGAPGRRSGEVAYALGEDDVAAGAYGEAADLVEAFVPTLAPERAASVLAAPPVTEILSAAGRTSVA